MADADLKEVLTDYQNLAEAEHHSFLSSLVNSYSFVNTVFGSLQIYEERSKPPETLKPLCDLLFTVYRETEHEFKQFTLQFLPSLLHNYLVYTTSSGLGKEEYHSLETFLVGMYNIECGEEADGGKARACRIPNIAQGSIYHESSVGLELSRQQGGGQEAALSERGSGGQANTDKCPVARLQQMTSMTAQSRPRVVAYLYRSYCRHLAVYTKFSLDQSCRAAYRTVTRGFSVFKSKVHRRQPSAGSDGAGGLRLQGANRIPLSAQALLEILQLAYYSVFNGFAAAGVSLARAVEYRGTFDCLPNVVMVSHAVLALAPRAAAASAQQGGGKHIATPTRLTKNLITNASFRTKKLEGDIPRVEDDDDSRGSDLTPRSAMSAISEQLEALEGRGGPKARDSEALADKIKAKMENVRIRKKEKERQTFELGERDEKAKLVDYV